MLKQKRLSVGNEERLNRTNRPQLHFGVEACCLRLTHRLESAEFSLYSTSAISNQHTIWRHLMNDKINSSQKNEPREQSKRPTTVSRICIRFTVYTHNFLFDDNKYVTCQFIVLKHSDGILQFTDFHKYIGSPSNTIQRYTSDGNSRFYIVVQLLNYAFFHAGIQKLDDITGTIISDFLNAYGMCQLPWDTEYTKRTEDTVKRCIRTVMDFMELYLEDRKKYCSMKTEDLYKFVNRRNRHGRAIKVKVLKFKVIYTGSKRQIYRVPVSKK